MHLFETNIDNGMLMDGVSKSVQPYKFGGKELDRIGGINHYDFHARQLQLPILHFYQQDPYADKYPHLSPYLYCAANPLKYVDPSGERVELYATSLPGSELPFATHTFIVVRDETNKVKGYYAYGSEYDGVKGAFTGRLMQVNYTQDMMVYNNKDTKHLKKIIEITPPKGMNSLDFDKKVMSVAESFGNSSDITYFLAPSGSNLTKGNCNTSTSTILLKSGISKEQIDKIKAEIPGLSWGFNSNPRPWTKQEQMEAKKIQNQIEFLYNLIIKP